PPVAHCAGLGDVGQDPEDPGPQRGAAFEAVEALEDAEPGLRGDVLRSRLGRHIDPRDAHERRLVLAHQLSERLLVALAQRVDELRLAGHGADCNGAPERDTIAWSRTPPTRRSATTR